MPRKRPKPVEGEEPPNNRYSVLIEAEIVPRLKFLAGALGLSVPDLVNARLASLLEMELKAAIRKHGFDICDEKKQ